MFTRYDSFVNLAETLQWDEATIDFAPDKAAWPVLDDTEKAQVLGLIAGFCIAESAVSGHLGSFQAAASDDWVAAAFRAQARDEHRHARFFDRVAAEVAAVPGADIAARQGVLHPRQSRARRPVRGEPPGHCPAPRRRPRGSDRRGRAVSHGARGRGPPGWAECDARHARPPVRQASGRSPGVHLVLRDERWHIGFGTRLVQGAELGHDEVEALLALGQAAAGAWGDLVSPTQPRGQCACTGPGFGPSA